MLKKKAQRIFWKPIHCWKSDNNYKAWAKQQGFHSPTVMLAGVVYRIHDPHWMCTKMISVYKRKCQFDQTAFPATLQKLTYDIRSPDENESIISRLRRVARRLRVTAMRNFFCHIQGHECDDHDCIFLFTVLYFETNQNENLVYYYKRYQ